MRFPWLLGLIGVGAVLWSATVPPAAVLTPPVRAVDAIPPRTAALRDLEYARVQGRSLRLDLFRPHRQPTRLPLVIWIHGGAYCSGSKDELSAAHALLLRGFAVASVDYRFSQVAPFPAQIHDCKAAVRWLRKNALAYGLDPDRFGVWGQSAGGHLAALLGTTSVGRELEGEDGVAGASSAVQAVCDWSGPSDLTRIPVEVGSKVPLFFPLLRDAAARLLGGSPEERQELASIADPMRYASRGCPPFLIVHGLADEVVPVTQATRLADHLQSRGVDATLHLVPDVGHLLSGRELLRQAADFFDRHLRPAGQKRPVARARGVS